MRALMIITFFFWLSSIAEGQYSSVEVTIPGGVDVYGTALNDAGVVTGRYSVSSGSNTGAFRWNDGVGEILSPPHATLTFFASGLAINNPSLGVDESLPILDDSCWVVGAVSNIGLDFRRPNASDPRIWINEDIGPTTITAGYPLGFGGDQSYSCVNDLRQAIGQYEDSFGTERVFLRDGSGGFSVAPVIGLFPQGEDLNNNGIALIATDIYSASRTTQVWDLSLGTLNQLPTGGPTNIQQLRGRAINDLNWIVGEAFEFNPTGARIAYLASPTSVWAPSTLGLINANATSTANDLNDRIIFPSTFPQVVGQEITSSGLLRAVLWDGGIPVDLTLGAFTLIPGWGGDVIQDAVAINELGQILVNAQDPSSGIQTTHLLTPIVSTQSGIVPGIVGQENYHFTQGIAIPGQVVAVWAGLIAGSTPVPGTGASVDIGSAVSINYDSFGSFGSTDNSGISIQRIRPDIPPSLVGTTILTQSINMATGITSEVRTQILN